MHVPVAPQVIMHAAPAPHESRQSLAPVQSNAQVERAHTREVDDEPLPSTLQFEPSEHEIRPPVAPVALIVQFAPLHEIVDPGVPVAVMLHEVPGAHVEPPVHVSVHGHPEPQ